METTLTPLPTPSQQSESAEHDEIATLRREMRPLVPAAAVVRGTETPLFRLLCRALYGPPRDAATELRQLRLAKFAIESSPEGIRWRLYGHVGAAVPEKEWFDA